MEKLQDPQDIYVRQRRWLTVFFALLALLLLACVIILPIAFAVHPDESMGEGQTAFWIVTVIAAVVFGIPLAFAFIALCVKLRNTFLIVADEKGIYLNSTVVPYGFIPWDNIAQIRYYGVFDLADAIFAPDTNHLRITLRSKKQFLQGLNAVQRIYFRLGFSRLYCNLALCKGKGREIGAALQAAWQYYTGREIIEE